MLADPRTDAANGLSQALAQRREAVVDARRDGSVHAPRYQTVAFQLAQGLGQHLMADAANPPLQIRKAHFPL